MDAAALWTDAYQGEVLGETFFGLLAERQADPARRRDLELLAELERATRELAEPVFDRNGFDRGDTAGIVASVAGGVDQAAEAPWDATLRSVVAVAETFLPKYQQLVELSEGEDRDVARAYVEHELALVAFARRSLGDEPGDPIEPLAALAHMAGRIGPR